MRPYLAIIKDSFRAALASRVLYVLLGIITLLLMLIAPFHYREVLDWQVKINEHVQNPESFVKRLVDRKVNPDYPEITRIWDSFSEKLQTDLLATAEKIKNKDEGVSEEKDTEQELDESEDDPPRRRRGRRRGPDGENPFEDYPVFEQLIEEVNETIQDESFYRKEDWEGKSLNDEANGLIESMPLNEERSRRLNRLLIAEAMGASIRNGASTALDFYYLVWKIPFLSTNTTHQQFSSMFASNIPWFFDKFVMSIGLLIAILVTANIIPETFDPGSLNLLLSKPISRWGLLVAKFIGGCAFVALCSMYLFFGAWAWLGLGMGIWDQGILYSIPIYILAFAIYYSISTLIGIWYRSPILSVILTGLFWAICFLVGYSFFLFDNRMSNSEITKLVPVQEELLQVDPMSKVRAWDEKSNDWNTQLKAAMAQEQEVGIGVVLFFGPIGLPGGLGPVYDEESQSVLSGLINIAQGPAAMGQQDCHLSGTDKIDFKNIGRFPRDTVALFPSRKGPLAINGSGKVYRFKTEMIPELLADAENEDSKVTIEEPGESKSTSGRIEIFDEVSSTRTIVNGSHYVDLNRENEELLIYRKGKIHIFAPKDEAYEQRAELEIDTGVESTSMSCFVSYQGNTITLVLGNGQIITVDADAVKEKNGYLPESRSAIAQVEASPNGRWVAFVYKNGTCWLLDNESDSQISKANLRGQGTISCASFTNDSQLWIADRTDRATLYDLETNQQLKEVSPPGEWFANVYRYGLGPVYRVFPKPGELYKVATHLSSSGDTKYNREVDLTRKEETKDPWVPLWSGLGFMACVLALACFSFSRKDY